MAPCCGAGCCDAAGGAGAGVGCTGRGGGVRTGEAPGAETESGIVRARSATCVPTNRLISKYRKSYHLVQISRKDGQTLVWQGESQV